MSKPSDVCAFTNHVENAHLPTWPMSWKMGLERRLRSLPLRKIWPSALQIRAMGCVRALDAEMRTTLQQRRLLEMHTETTSERASHTRA